MTDQMILHLAKKKEFLQLIENKREAERQFNKAYELYYDELQWIMSREACQAMEKELDRLCRVQDQARQAVVNARAYFTPEELKEMRKEYAGE